MKHPEKSETAGGSPRPHPDETYKRHAVELSLRGDPTWLSGPSAHKPREIPELPRRQARSHAHGKHR